jgi:hypothetical protein
MRARRTCATLLGTVCLILSAVALSAKWPTAYWNVSFNEGPLSCTPIERRERDLRAFFEARNRRTCVSSDEGDHLLFSCGDKIKEVVVFSREGCAGWLEEPMTPERSRNLAAFNGCFAKAKDRIGRDMAIPYCSCTTASFARYSEEEIGKLPRAQIEAIAKACLAEVSGGSGRPR